MTAPAGTSPVAAEAGGRIDLTLNGEPYQLAPGATVADLIASLGRDARTVAVERNGDLLARALFSDTRLAAGDRIEVVHFVQGGAS